MSLCSTAIAESAIAAPAAVTQTSKKAPGKRTLTAVADAKSEPEAR